jgi:hypothetical protein
MTPHLIVQASGAIYQQSQGWAFLFAMFVTGEEGIPVGGLRRENFSVWTLTGCANPKSLA